jgi:hypothetical protein
MRDSSEMSYNCNLDVWWPDLSDVPFNSWSNASVRIVTLTFFKRLVVQIVTVIYVF